MLFKNSKNKNLNNFSIQGKMGMSIVSESLYIQIPIKLVNLNYLYVHFIKLNK